MKTLLLVVALLWSDAVIAGHLLRPRELRMDAGWKIQSSAQIRSGGDKISTSTYAPKSWFEADLPATVASALVQAGALKNPYFSKNLRDLPGVTYNVGSNFSNQEMAADSPY